MKTTAFDSFAGLCAILAGVCIFLYSVAFIVIARSSPALGAELSALLLLLSGLLAAAALVGLYERLRQGGEGFALLALGLGLAGAFGSAVHGGYDLANIINAPPTAAAGLPSQVDPRGLLTFGVAGLAVLVFAWLMRQGGGFPPGLGYVGYVLAVLLVIIYLGRLIVLQVSNPVLLVPVLLAGFIANPVWYIWLGLALRQGPQGRR